MFAAEQLASFIVRELELHTWAYKEREGVSPIYAK